MELLFGIPNWPHADPISAEELVNRLQRRFPTMVIDHEKGNAFVQERLDAEIAFGYGEGFLSDTRKFFNKTIYVSISDRDWQGATATSYLRPIWEPALDGVSFDVLDTVDEAIRCRISADLAAALDMALCSEIDWETGGRLPGA